MPISGSASISAQEIWDLLESSVTSGIGLHIKDELAELIARKFPANFYDFFNRSSKDADVWTETLDGAGLWEPSNITDRATAWKLTTGNVINNDSGIHGLGTPQGKRFTIDEAGYDTVTLEACLRMHAFADQKVMIGLFTTAQTGFIQPNEDSIMFFYDTVVNANWNARSYNGAEEETDTTIVRDTAWHDFKIVWTATDVKFYIDNVLKATHAVQIPNVPLGLVFLVRTSGAAAKTTSISKLTVELS